MTDSYSLATSTWNEKELKAIQSVIDKDVYTMGDSVGQFENDFCKFT
jgi:CDP-6-deoxy-D-xylo-4-hexulose-3-dehydrase